MARIQAAAIENLMNTIDDNEERKESLTSEVYSILLAMLVNEDIPSGTILNRRTVANQLGVSVAPILEAFNRLEWEGFLKTIPRKGTMVIVPSVTDVIENMIVREALEAQGLEFLEAEVQMVPNVYVKLDEKDSERMEKFLERLDELDDVSSVYHKDRLWQEYRQQLSRI